MDTKINPAKLKLLELLFDYDKFRECIIMDGAYAKEIKVLENGDIQLGKTGSGWINSLFNCYKIIDFATIAYKLAAIITNSLTEKNEILVGLIHRISENAVLENKREKVIDLLWQYMVLFDKESPFYSNWDEDENPPITPIGKTYIGFGDKNVEIPVVNIPVELLRKSLVIWLGLTLNKISV